MPALYIADGHHRSAAASRVAAARAPPGRNRPADYFLAVIFPHHQMKILDYNRVVKDLNGLDRKTNSSLASAPTSPSTPAAAASIRHAPASSACTSAAAGIKLTIKPGARAHRSGRQPRCLPAFRPRARPAARHRRPAPRQAHRLRRRHPRPRELEKRVDSGEMAVGHEMAVAFALHPTRMDQLMAVADSNEVMPPKSTWFEPKLADGLVSHVID
jgi:hypothetical protein